MNGCNECTGAGAGLGTLVAGLTYTRLGPRVFYAMCSCVSLSALCIYALFQFVLLERCEPRDAIPTSAADTAELSVADARDHRRADHVNGINGVGDRHVLYYSAATAHDKSDAATHANTRADTMSERELQLEPQGQHAGERAHFVQPVNKQWAPKKAVGETSAEAPIGISYERVADQTSSATGPDASSNQEHRVDVDDRLHILHNELDDSEPEIEISPAPAQAACPTTSSHPPVIPL